jgi:hypothetical protein
MQLSVSWRGLQTTWVPRRGRLDQSMDRQTVFCTPWKASSDSVAQRPMAATPQEEAGDGGSRTRSFTLVQFV